MKRRTGEMCSKWPRRTVNRSRGKLGSVAENVWWCSPGFVYIRVLSFWAFVLVVDFLLEFRLELLWPLWLLLTSVYDSFKYQGLAFSVFFVCLSLTADFLCFLFIPVQWLFFVAPTYVWIQYVWHTERGICLPTICLWVLFIYVEASIRLKDLKHFPGHLDLCRPFAAHCIGYPVVTWGFDIKGYVSYRIRQRKQREVAKENEFYYELLVQSLPAEQQEAYHLRNSSAQQALSSTVEDLASVPLANGSSSVPSSATCNSNSSAASAASKHVSSFSSSSNTSSSSIKKDKEKNAEKNYEKKGSFQDFHEALDAASLIKEKEKERGEKEKDKDKDKERDKEKEREKEKEKRNKLNNSTQIVSSNNTNNAHIKQRNNIHSNSSNEANTTPPPSEHVLRLEADIKRLKADLQASRQSEAELRSQLAQLTSNERSVRAELSQSQQDNDSLQAKLHGLVSARQSDKQTMASLEKRLQEERKCRMLLETQLANERRNRANDVIEATKAQQRSKSTNGVGECGENCRQRRRELEMEVQQLRRDNKSAEDRLRTMDLEIQHLRRSQQTTTPPQQQQQQLQQQQHQQQQLQQQQHQQQQLQQQQHQQQQLQQQQHQQQQHQHQQQQHQHQQHNVETELLVSALAALQDKTSHLESSLSAETRLKLDLFSALGEAKRQLEHRENLLLSREREISELKAKVTEVLAVMPTLNDSSQLGHNMGISELNNHGLGSMGSLSSYLSTYPLSMTDLGLSSNLNLGDLNLDHGSTSPITLTPSSPLTPMRPYTSKLFNHANGGSMGVNMSGGNGIDTDKGSKPGSNLDPNATAYTPKAMGNGEL